MIMKRKSLIPISPLVLGFFLLTTRFWFRSQTRAAIEVKGSPRVASKHTDLAVNLD
jgi:hypothetical protein